jgi:hypothetical protein
MHRMTQGRISALVFSRRTLPLFFAVFLASSCEESDLDESVAAEQSSTENESSHDTGTPATNSTSSSSEADSQIQTSSASASDTDETSAQIDPRCELPEPGWENATCAGGTEIRWFFRTSVDNSEGWCEPAGNVVELCTDGSVFPFTSLEECMSACPGSRNIAAQGKTVETCRSEEELVYFFDEVPELNGSDLVLEGSAGGGCPVVPPVTRLCFTAANGSEVKLRFEVDTYGDYCEAIKDLPPKHFDLEPLFVDFPQRPLTLVVEGNNSSLEIVVP